MDTNKKFFVYGLQRSGTNYLRRVIESNTDLSHEEIGWKHAIEDFPSDVFKVAIVKSPYNWASSICKRQRADIVRRHKDYNLKEYSPDNYRDINLANLMRLWSDWVRFFQEREILLLKYEDLISEPFWLIKQIGLQTGCMTRLPPVMQVKNKTLKLSDDQRLEYLKTPTTDDPLVRQINKYIDPTLLDQLGYRYAKGQ